MAHRYGGGDQHFDAEVDYIPNSNQFQQQHDMYEEQDYDPHGGDHSNYLSGDYAAVPDVLQLNHLCANAMAPVDSSEDAKTEANESWEPVREWLRSHNADEVRQAAEQRGESSMTALHFACRNQPPVDVINVFLSIAMETVQWPDTFGWLPLHYACACGADTLVIKALAEAYPESKTTVDRRGRTPLHFCLGNGNQNPDKLAAPALVAILSSSGAAAYADDNGMLPLHYACAYGASEEALLVLTHSHRPAIGTRDRNNRTPLHFALSNAGRPASPGAVRHLLELDPRLANSNDGVLPLRVLAEFSQTLRRDGDESDRESVQKCLEHLLNANPDPTAGFFAALQSLPDWLSERAVVMASVQVLLNYKISQRFPTLFLMADFYFQVMIIYFYSWNVVESLKRRYDANTNSRISFESLSPLYVGAGCFLFREFIQMISLISLKSFHVWVYDGSNWVNVVYIVLVLYWTIVMNTGAVENGRFRTGVAISVSVLWIKILAFLRNMQIEFAVFAGGVFYVFRRLVAFLTALGIILVAFAQMFVTVFMETPYCAEENAPEECNADDPTAETCCPEETENKPYCNFWFALVNVYTMLLGEVDEVQFFESRVAVFLFCIFMFLVVILLANVLIAIVTENYKVIQEQRAAIVFWTNRLDFVAEMDAMANGPWKQRIRKSLGMDPSVENTGHVDVVFGKEFWKRLMDLFEDDVEENLMTVEFWAYNLLRIITAIIIIPSWVALGILSGGWLWPPQLRELIFTSQVNKHSSESEREDELRKTQVVMLRKEVVELRDELTHELQVDRIEVIKMKSDIDARRVDIANEMKHIKRIMTMLFDQQAAL